MISLTHHINFSLNLPPEDLALLRWKLVEVLQWKEQLRRMAVRIRNRRYTNLDESCRQMEHVVDVASRYYEDLYQFLRGRNLLCVWVNLGNVWNNFNILAFDRRWS